MWQSIVKNWTTSVPGALAAFCGGAELMELLPEAWRAKAMAVCGILVAFGLIAAKSANVTHNENGEPEIVGSKPSTTGLSEFWLPMLLVGGLLGLTGCASDLDMGNGRVVNLAKVESRSCFGVNDSRSRLRNCIKTIGDGFLEDKYVDCHWTEEDWKPSSSQGQCGQMVSGALQAIGFGVAGAMIGSTSNTATAGASSLSTVVVPPVKGHH